MKAYLQQGHQLETGRRQDHGRQPLLSSALHILSALYNRGALRRDLQSAVSEHVMGYVKNVDSHEKPASRVRGGRI